MKLKKSLYALAMAGASIVIPNTTQAGLTFELQEVGSDVVLSYVTGGSINLTGLGSPTSYSASGALNPSSFYFNLGSGTYDFYLGSSVTGPSSFGSGSLLASSSDSGSFLGFGFVATAPALGVPTGYTSGSIINTASSSTFSGQNFSTLGVTAGTYVWTFANTDTITLQVGPASAVPEASGSVAGLGLAVAGLYQLRRRRQNTVTQ